MVLKVTTITTLYAPVQDRIRLAVADAQGERRVYWLTRRMLLRLAPALLEGLDEQIDAPAEVEPEQLEVANVYAQLQARLTQKPAKPVLADEATPEALLHEVSVTRMPRGGKLLTLRARDMDAAAMELHATAVRQWLEVLKRESDQAEWHLGVWPEWMLGVGG